MQRLADYTPAWPLPKIFRITPGVFTGETINTPSMLCVADALDGLRWAERIGGLPALIARSEANLAAVARWLAACPWAEFLAADPAARSPTSICLRAEDGPAIAKLLDAEGVAFDIANYRDAPPGLRIWGGATVETADIEALLPWLDWAHASLAAPAMV
jgi:phosphoserine aminotransferase